ncbi:hypothetical protein DACRYDRAFT_21844 [Dacryopinax primogenitus]|uniref:Uncharacterized protein n=1 Tax=Dacryopinax primogenitus (strain DJM 731) TaxID=1858805 RepID=M5G3W2_DACPD|nr:uncharacterized protein DACRYDRAFT_21844 [Dacryopinax primogenitus]EJU02900.1 hypothetical protein DACRYDRAFT_21844 [Dacryopinax primogenitus]
MGISASWGKSSATVDFETLASAGCSAYHRRSPHTEVRAGLEVENLETGAHTPYGSGFPKFSESD